MATVTIQGESYTVYADYADVDEYLQATLHATSWQEALEDARHKAMVTATRVFNRTRWAGEPSVEGQALAFPRDGLTDADGNELADAVTPQSVLDAFSELSGLILADTTLQAKANTGSNVKRVQAGSASVEFFRPTASTAARFPPAVHELLRPFLAGNQRAQIVVSGAGTASSFASTDFGMSPGGLP